MVGFNEATLVGLVHSDPTLSKAKSGDPVCRFTLITKDMVGNGEQWHNVLSVRKIALDLKERVRKGDALLIKGKILYRLIRDEDNKKVSVTDIRVKEYVLMDALEPLEDSPGVNNDHEKEDYDDGPNFNC